MDELAVSALIKLKAVKQPQETWERILDHCPSVGRIRDTMIHWEEKHRKMYTFNMPKQVPVSAPFDYYIGFNFRFCQMITTKPIPT